MAAKDVRFSADAREKMLRGVDILANAVKVTLSTAPAVIHGKVVVVALAVTKTFRGLQVLQQLRHRLRLRRPLGANPAVAARLAAPWRFPQSRRWAPPTPAPPPACAWLRTAVSAYPVTITSRDYFFNPPTR